MDDDAIPIVETYKGIGLEADQSPRRLKVVRREIDLVLGMTDLDELAAFAGSAWNAPEARQLACAMAETAFEISVEERRLRPSIDMEKLRASVAGLGCKRWRDPDHYGTLLDPRDAVLREQPLPDLE